MVSLTFLERRSRVCIGIRVPSLWGGADAVRVLKFEGLG